jgi:hypothetical protein
VGTGVIVGAAPARYTPTELKRNDHHRTSTSNPTPEWEVDMSTDRKPLFLVSTEGKTEDEIADEVMEQLRALGIEVSDDVQQ